MERKVSKTVLTKQVWGTSGVLNPACLLWSEFNLNSVQLHRQPQFWMYALTSVSFFRCSRLFLPLMNSALTGTHALRSLWMCDFAFWPGMHSLWKCFCSPLQQLNARVAWCSSAAALEVCRLLFDAGAMSLNTSVSSLNAEGEFLMLFKNFTSLRFIWGDVHQCIIYLVETGTSGLSFCSGFDSGEDQERLLTEFSPLMYFSWQYLQYHPHSAGISVFPLKYQGWGRWLMMRSCCWMVTARLVSHARS